MEPSNGKAASKRGIHRTPQVDCLVDARADLAQGLVWDDQTHRLFWIDTPAGQLFAVSLTSGVVQSWSLPCAVSAIALCRDGRVLVALLDGVYLFDLVTHDLHFLTALDVSKAGSAGSIGPDGAFWIHGAGRGAERALLRVAPDGSVSRVTGAEASAPSGSAIDIEGGYWRCDATNACVQRFSSDGEVLMRIALPVPAPTSCCFGGADLRLLLVASRRNGLEARALSGSPMSGGIFMIPVDVAGVKVSRFGTAERLRRD
jgi:sugar lactone lactonase YvrE